MKLLIVKSPRMITKTKDAAAVTLVEKRNDWSMEILLIFIWTKPLQLFFNKFFSVTLYIIDQIFIFLNQMMQEHVFFAIAYLTTLGKNMQFCEANIGV